MGSTGRYLTVSQPCSYESLFSPDLRRWAELMRPYWDEAGIGMDLPVHRKIWEWAFIANTLARHEMLKPGMRGLGFGVGKEPLVPLFASLGCQIVATDQSADAARTSGWSESNQFAGEANHLNEHGLCSQQLFDELVCYRTADMRNIPGELRDFDFTWSSCAFEHLGTIEEGIRFVLNQMDCLRPGGIAAHTTEFNVSSNSNTISSGPTVLFRRKDLQRLARLLRKVGGSMKLDFTLGVTEFDRHIDRPPWSGAHLRLEHDGFAITSFGIAIRKRTSGIGRFQRLFTRKAAITQKRF